MNFNLYSDLYKDFKIIDLEGNNHSQDLLDILKDLNLKHDGTAKSILDVTQKNLLRPAGKERWEIEDIFSDKKNSISAKLKNLGCISAIYPDQTFYDYVLLLGGSLKTLRTRLAFASKLWERGIRFKTLVFLVGERTLDERVESKEMILDEKNEDLPFRNDWKFSGVYPTTETSLAKIVFDQSQIPLEMRNINIIFIDTPMQKSSNGLLRRPTTDDTVIEWLSRKPAAGKCLAISNQPFVRYQHSVLKRLLPTDFYLETVGAQITEDKSIAIQLDSLARWIYSEFNRLSACKSNA
jgi:hypothetical protein